MRAVFSFSKFLLALAICSSVANAKVIQVLPGHDTLRPALEAAEDGDTLVLIDGSYTIEGTLSTDKIVSLRAAVPGQYPLVEIAAGHTMTFNRTGAAITVQGIEFAATPLVNNNRPGLLQFGGGLRL